MSGRSMSIRDAQVKEFDPSNPPRGFVAWTALECLHFLNKFQVPYRFNYEKGRFEAQSNHREMTRNALYSIRQRRLELAELIEPYDKTSCSLCKGCVEKPVRVYRVSQAMAVDYHAHCFEKIAGKENSIREAPADAYCYEMAQWIYDEGLCCYCNTDRAQYPEYAPNICAGCYVVRQMVLAGQAAIVQSCISVQTAA